MIDQRFVESFIRSKVLLEEELVKVGEISGSPEIENQLILIEARMVAMIELALRHGIDEINTMRRILTKIDA